MQMSIEDKPSGSLIFNGDDDSERDSGLLQGFNSKCRTTKERSLDFNENKAIISGMGEGLEPSDTIVKENSVEADPECKQLAQELVTTNTALLSAV